MASMGHNHIKILPVKSTTDASGGGVITHAFEGVAWASQHGAKVINMSWGGGDYSATDQAVINDAYNNGCMLIAAAGNSSNSNFLYPAAYNNVVAVVSTTATDAVSSFSSYGNWVDICAPGSAIYSTYPFGTYAYASGTSMASPLTASIFAYVWSINPNLTQVQLEALIKNNCDNIDAQNPTKVGLMGAGRINAYRAALLACPNPPPVSISPNGTQVLCPPTTSLNLTVTTIANATYQWIKDGAFVGTNQPTFSAIETGSYGVTVTGSDGCPSVATPVKITIFPNTVSISANKAPVVCGSDSVILTVPYLYGVHYSWKKDGVTVGADSNRLAAKVAGDFSVIVSSNSSSCTVTSDVIAVTSIIYTAQITPSTNPITLCSGVAILSVTPLSGASYQWKRDGNFVGSDAPTYNAAVSGSYSVNVVKSACTFSPANPTVFTLLPTALTVTADRSTSICLGQSVILSTTNLAGLTYQWKKGGVNISGANSATYTAQETGNFTVTASIGTSCSVTSNIMPVTVLNQAITLTSSKTVACTGGQIVLTATAASGGSYDWYNGANLLTTTSSNTFNATTTGSYQVKVTQNACLTTSNTINLEFNSTQTSSPSTQNGIVCNGNIYPVTATGIVNCPITATSNFTYAGGTVGYDAGSQSGNNPTATVSGISSTINQIRISITWEKKDGGNYNTCGNVHGGGDPYNSELSFQVQSPTGTVVTLVPQNTYGGNYGGVVTTVFQDGAATISPAATPISGTFAPNEALSVYNTQNVNGIWTVLPVDGGTNDPLCVSGFSVTVVTLGTPVAPAITWWDAPTNGNQVGSGTSYTPVGLTTGATYYAEALCNTYCQSVRIPALIIANRMQTIKVGDWNDPTVWSCNRIPTITDDVFIYHNLAINGTTGFAQNVSYQTGVINFLNNGLLKLKTN